jgi:integrase
MATTKIYLRKSALNKNGLAPLRIRLKHEDKIKEITLPGARVAPEKWDETKERVTGDKMLTHRIQAKKLEYQAAINQAEALGIKINLEDIHEVVAGKKKLAANSTSKDMLLYKFIEEYIETNKDFAYGTRKIYRTLKLLMRAEYPKVKLSDIDGDFMIALELKLKKRGLKINTIHSRLKCLKAAINRAYEYRMIEKPDLRGFKLKKEKVVKTFLDLFETKVLLEYLKTMTGTTNDQNILKSFIWSCHCAMRFGDCCVLTYEQFSIDNDGSVRLTYKMRKTPKEISFVLNDTALGLIDKTKIGIKEMVFQLIPYNYIHGDADTLSKKIEARNAYVNKRLKLIMTNAAITKRVTYHICLILK